MPVETGVILRLARNNNLVNGNVVPVGTGVILRRKRKCGASRNGCDPTPQRGVLQFCAMLSSGESELTFITLSSFRWNRSSPASGSAGGSSINLLRAFISAATSTAWNTPVSRA